MRNYNLDILRIIFALLVVIMHINIDSPLKHFSLINKAYIFVDFFFVLSAFVLFLSYKRDNSSVIKLAIKRFKRLYPLHLFILVLFFLFELVKYFVFEKYFHLNTNAFNDETSLSSLVVSLLLLDSFNIYAHNIWNAPAWSISAELYAYFLLLLFTFLGKKFRVIIFCLITLFVVFFVIRRGSLDYGSNFGIVRCLYSYLLVVLFFQINLSRIVNFIYFLLSLLLLVFYFIFSDSFVNYEFLLPVLFTYIIFFIYYKIPSFKHNKYLIKLADLSFEIYLVQALVIVFFSDLFILFKNKFNSLFYIDKSGLIVFNDPLIALIATLIIVVLVILSSIVVSKTLDKLQRIKL